MASKDTATLRPGHAVSVRCDQQLGFFQGVVKEVHADRLIIVRVFRNGVPLKKQNAQVTLWLTDIEKITVLNLDDAAIANEVTPFKGNNSNAYKSAKKTTATAPATTAKQNNEQQQRCIENIAARTQILSTSAKQKPPSPHQLPHPPQKTFQQQMAPPTHQAPSRSVAEFFGRMIPPKVEARLSVAVNATAERGGGSVEAANNFNSTLPMLNGQEQNGGQDFGRMPNGGLPNKGKGAQRKQQLRRENSIRNQAFSGSADDPCLQEDFDFEGNLALFDKQAIWHDIESEQKPELVCQSISTQNTKYRHDEDILVKAPLQLRQIKSNYEGSLDFVTDEGLIIPTIPINARAQIENLADKCGLTMQRQADLLARGATDLAILLLGGARRLTPNNSHQWPTVAIVCDKCDAKRFLNIAATTGRQLACHGLKVLLYLGIEPSAVAGNSEVLLFKATGNKVVHYANELTKPDLVILTTQSNSLTTHVRKWIGDNRASILAIDPPAGGVADVCVKYAILPILPLNGISTTHYRKLYICNLGIPDKFYNDAGIQYKSPFGHKFVIPIHATD